MTLGCLDALRKVNFDDPTTYPRVIGHDGIPSVRRALLENDLFLAAVVMTEPKPLADRAVATLDSLIRNVKIDHHWARPLFIHRELSLDKALRVQTYSCPPGHDCGDAGA